MVFAIVVLLLIAVLFGIGLAAKAAAFLIWLALVLLVLWAIGWFVGAAGGATTGGTETTSRRRWFYW
jgi:hypothetical protein